MLRPVAATYGKFSERGLVKPEALLSKIRNARTAEALAKKANFGLSANTHESYKTAINHIRRCEEETLVDMSLPFDD